MSYSPALPLFGVEASMIVDAAAVGLSFSDYCNLKMQQNDSDALEPINFRTSTKANQWYGRDDAYGTWEKSIDCGRSYLVGREVPTASFLATHTSKMQPWQKLIFHWVVANPSLCLVLESFDRSLYYTVSLRGEYVEFGLPHQDQGGEKHWVSRDGLNRVLVNVD
jgi:hypothetical protein